MTPDPKRPRITREEAIRRLGRLVRDESYEWSHEVITRVDRSAIFAAIRALKREQKAASKKKEAKR